jgi:hypothetical protein
MPVVAKFHPVPTAPVFCPQPNPTKPAGFESPVEKKKTSSNKPVPLKKATLPPKPQKVPPPSSKPEEIPPPPPTSPSSKAEKAPREFELPAEPPEWVFTNAEAKPEPPAFDKPISTKIRAVEPTKRR